MASTSAGNIKNIAVVGHSGSGKTSLAEALLFYAKATDRLGKTQEGNTVCDFDTEEIKRQVSISLSVAPFGYGKTKVNLLDTPGLFDFEAGLREGVRAAESVLIAISGKSGVSVGAHKAYKLALASGKSRLIFVSKLDSENADFYKVLEELKNHFGPSICPIVVPFYENSAVKCYIDLIDRKAYTYDANGNPKETAMPDTGHRLDGLINAISEAVAETDEPLFEKYFSGEKFTHEELVKGIHEGVKSGQITPVFCGSSVTMEGIAPLMEALCNILPSAQENGGEKALDASSKEVELSCSEAGSLVAYVFKTIADPFVGKLSYVKVVSGILSPEKQMVNARTGASERMGKLLIIKGKKQTDTDRIVAGDIGAVAKLSETMTGDTLCEVSKVYTLLKHTYPNPTLTMAVQTKNKGDESKISHGILRLMEEDPSIRFEIHPETHQMLLTGLGETHLDVTITKLKQKFGVDAGLEPPMIAYRETIRKKVKVQGKHKKQTGGHGQYGDVWIEFEPHNGEDLIFEEKVVGGAVPKGFFPAVEKGLRDCIKRGVVAGYPVVSLKATLVDGSYHDVDSSEMAFKMAAALAYRAGLPQASPILLEPIGMLKALVPDSNTGDLLGEVNKRRGRVLGMNPDEDGMQLVEAEIPMSEMADFTTYMRSSTQGRGSFAFTFERYEPLPQMLEQKVKEQAKIFFGEEE